MAVVTGVPAYQKLASGLVSQITVAASHRAAEIPCYWSRQAAIGSPFANAVFPFKIGLASKNRRR